MLRFFASILLFVLFWGNALSQRTRVNIQAAADLNANVSMMYYDVKYTPTPGISLFDTKYESVLYFDCETQKSETAYLTIKSPQILVLSAVPKKPNGSLNYMRHLFISPGDELTVKISGDLRFTFDGASADYQRFLQQHSFSELPYNNLTKLGYQTNRTDNWEVVQRMDSLQQARKNGYESLKTKLNGKVSPVFDAYVQAIMTTDPYLLRAAVTAKQMRNNTGAKLSIEEAKALRKLCLDNFKVLSDDALLNQTYRQELKNFVMFQVTNPAIDTTAKRYMSGENVKKAYDLTTTLLGNANPRQREYLHTHWLDYAVGTLNDPNLAQTILEDYRTRYQTSTLNQYFDTSIKTRLGLATGEVAPDFTIKNTDNKDVSLKTLRGKPVLLIFSFAVKQHEANLKMLEDKYGSKLTFLYVTVTPYAAFEAWQPTVQPRPNTAHWWASDADADKLKATYLASASHPFVLIDAQGNLIKRWIPQEFPLNKTLQNDLKGLFP